MAGRKKLEQAAKPKLQQKGKEKAEPKAEKRVQSKATETKQVAKKAVELREENNEKKNIRIAKTKLYFMLSIISN